MWDFIGFLVLLWLLDNVIKTVFGWLTLGCNAILATVNFIVSSFKKEKPVTIDNHAFYETQEAYRLNWLRTVGK